MLVVGSMGMSINGYIHIYCTNYYYTNYYYYYYYYTIVFSRLWVVYAIMLLSPTVSNSPYCALATLSWCLVEVPRYAYYATNILHITPKPLLWLRYSLFGVLYPTGITGELGCTWLALSYLSTATQPEVKYVYIV